jgi:hypothetical protein
LRAKCPQVRDNRESALRGASVVVLQPSTYPPTTGNRAFAVSRPRGGEEQSVVHAPSIVLRVNRERPYIGATILPATHVRQREFWNGPPERLAQNIIFSEVGIMTETKPTNAVDALKMLWEEYRYRHELCWRVPIQTTVAAVILSTVPYAQCHIVPVLGRAILLVPLLGVVLTLFVMTVMARELERLSAVRDRYRELQSPVLDVRPVPASVPWFTFDVRVWVLPGVSLCPASE